MSEENNNNQGYRIVETDLSPDGDVNTTVKAGSVEFSSRGEDLVWDDRFIEKVDSIQVRDLTASVQHKTVQKAMFDIFHMDAKSNSHALRTGLLLLLCALIITLATIYFWPSTEETPPGSGTTVSTSGTADTMAPFRETEKEEKH